MAADKKKYDQARIALHDLIDDQNLYMQKKLGELGVKLTIANQILDYTSIFNEFPLRWYVIYETLIPPHACGAPTYQILLIITRRVHCLQSNSV